MRYLMALIPPALFVGVLLLTRMALVSSLGTNDESDVRLPAWQVLFINIVSLLLTYWWMGVSVLLLVGLLIAHFANRP